MRDRENLFLFGQEADVATSGSLAPDGIIGAIDNRGGLRGEFAAGAVDEDCIIEFSSELRKKSASREYLVLCGNSFMRNATKSMRDYHVGGGVSFGNVTANKLGLSLNKYAFNDMNATFIEYDPFNDGQLLPQVGSGRDYQDFALWIDLGANSRGDSVIQPLCKAKPGGGDYRLQVANEPGLTAPFSVNGSEDIVVTGQDRTSVHLRSYIGLQVMSPNQLGYMEGK